jgi:hypothetical protein
MDEPLDTKLVLRKLPVGDKNDLSWGSVGPARREKRKRLQVQIKSTLDIIMYLSVPILNPEA